MHADFGVIVKAACDKAGTELKPQDIFDLFKTEYIGVSEPYTLKGYRFTHESSKSGGTVVTFKGSVRFDGEDQKISGSGNGPIDAFFKAIGGIGLDKYHFVSYSEQAISDGSDSLALSYIQLKTPDGSHVFGVDIDSDISVASIKAIMSAINRSLRK